ncbi:MAG: sugar transferase [Clostridia bacterium]|nr:sugar transferase [Clostridia bacterium]
MKEKKKFSLYNNFFKRFFDFIFSLLMIIVLSPILLLVYLLSFVILKGNPIFKQYRPGKNGKIFGVYKFRSMTNKKDKDGNLLPDKDRITSWGKFLRKCSIDELPQLFNILKGDMSFIGPRPRMVEECVFLNEDQQDRFKVRPGISGWAQVNGRNNITLDKVVEFDKEYVEKQSIGMDIKILFKTIACVFKRKDINKEGTVSNEFHGDYLLRTGKIDKAYYDEKISLAKEQIAKAKNK